VSFTSPQDQDIKEQVRQATDIVELIGGYLQLRRQGRNYVAICPWHDDTRPSLQVNPERQSWKCWVCDIGGDVFSFVMQHERVGFPESLEMLANRAGIPLRSSPQPKTQRGSPNDKRTLYDAAKWAEDQFHRCLLHAPEAATARQYLEERGITPASIERFHLGFSPDAWQWLLDRATTAPFSPQVLEAAGLCAKSPNSGRYYDFFRGRVIFSIRDVQGRPIAFGGRVLPQSADQKMGKYINSRETRLFSKSDQLYGLDVARAAVATQRENREIVVVEGYTDAVMAHQVGVDNVVAVLGTALGPGHIRLLRRFADKITLVLDADEAGQRRTNEILELFVAEQVDLRILSLPEGLDPCDFLLEQGADAFRKLLDGAVDALEHKLRSATEGINLASETHRANQALEDVLATLAKAPSPQVATQSEMRLREQQMLLRLTRQFNVSETEIRGRLNDLRRKAGNRRQTVSPSAQQPPSAGAPKVREIDSREAELLEILIEHPELVADAASEIEVGQLQSEATRAIYQTIRRIHDAGRAPDFGNVLTALDDPRLKNIWVELDERAHAKAEEALEDAQKRWQGLIADFRHISQDKVSRQELAALEEKRLSDQEELDALKMRFAQEKDRQGISAPTDG